MSIEIDQNYLDDVFVYPHKATAPPKKWRNRYKSNVRLTYMLNGGGSTVVGPGEYLSPEIFPSADLAETDFLARMDRAEKNGTIVLLEEAGLRYLGPKPEDE